MPPPVRRSVLVAVVTFACGLVLAGAAFAGNGGVAPPAPASPGAQDIRSIYWLILAISAAIFLLVTVTLVLFVVRYRSRGRPREVEGPQIRGHTNLELAWTAGPVVILAIIAGFVFWKVADIGATAGSPTSSPAREQVRIDGHQYYWEFTYPNGAVSVNNLRLPYNRPVRLKIVSHDVNHSWWVPALGGKLDAIPGKPNQTTWLATKLGTYSGQCAEFCGLLHAQMLAQVEVLPAAQYASFIRQRKTDKEALGKETFVGVCAKCHGLAGQGGYGPNIAANPLLGNKAGLTNILRTGVGKMPAVGNDWRQFQIDALVAYLHTRFHVSGGTSGSQG
jgi:cytochrome c oxidase subunit II